MLPGVLLVSRNLECALLPVIFVGLLGSTSLQGTNLDWSEKSTDTKVLRFSKYSSKHNKYLGRTQKVCTVFPAFHNQP